LSQLLLGLGLGLGTDLNHTDQKFAIKCGHVRHATPFLATVIIVHCNVRCVWTTVLNDSFNYSNAQRNVSFA